MKKVLIISYFFAQKEAIGAIRLHGLSKFLPYFDWEPTILTVKSQEKINSCCRVIETPYEDILIKWKRRLGLAQKKTVKEQFSLATLKNKKTWADSILDLWEEIFAFPDVYTGWYKYAIDSGNKLLENESFDAIISSSGPVTTHLIAKELINKHNISWVADLRDLWTQNHYYHYSRFRKIIEKKLEIKTFSMANALTTVSRPLAEKLKELHTLKNIYIITNGFDPDEKTTVIHLSEKFCITYTGSLYQGKRDPSPLFKALQELISKKVIDPGDVAVDFYGSYEDWLKRDVEILSLQNIVKIHGLVPRDTAVEKQRESQLLLLLTWNDPDEKGVCTGKVFDYLAARRPILSIGTAGGIIEELLNITKSGIHISNMEDIQKELKSAYCQFKSKGKVDYYGIDTEIDKYNQKEMARKFADVLTIVGK